MATGRRTVWTLLILLAVTSHVLSSPLSRFDTDTRCPEGEYRLAKHCCQMCPAGTYVVAPCQEAHGVSQCAECTPGKDYTAYSSGIHHCVTCTMCRDDQVQVKACSQTSDAVCRCKNGTYCPLQGSCEYCRRCKASCPGRVLEPCTDTANTVCAEDPAPKKDIDKKSSDNDQTSSVTVVLVVFSIAIVLVLIVIGILVGLRVIHCNVCPLPEHKTEMDPLQGSSSTLTSSPTPNMPRSDPEEDSEIQEMLETEGLVGEAEEERPLQAANGSSIPQFIATNSQSSLTEGGDTEDSVPLGVMEIGANFERYRKPPARSPVPSAPLVIWNEPGNLSTTSCAPRQLTDAEWTVCIYCFTEHVSHEDWKKFMRTINLRDHDIDQIVAGNISIDEQRYQMLSMWRKQNGRKASVQTLLDTLSKMNREGPRENVLNSLRSKGIFLFN